MSADASHRRCVVGLWTLVEAARGGDADQLRLAATRAHEAIVATLGGERYLVVQEKAGAIHVDGRQVSLGVDVFVATSRLSRLMQERGIGEILFDAAIGTAELEEWALGFCGAPPSVGQAPGISSSPRAGAGEPVLPIGRHAPAHDAGDSRLRAVFLENQLMAVVDETWPPATARGVVHGIVDHLLAVQGGLEPLTLLQADRPRLRRALAVAVSCVVFARVAGWPEARLGELGAMALLHDVGALLDDARPGPAGFHWLLERSADPFWLRSALVAGGWRDPAGHPQLLSVELVRLAVAFVARTDPGPGASAEPELPRELTAIAETAVRHFAPA